MLLCYNFIQILPLLLSQGRLFVFWNGSKWSIERFLYLLRIVSYGDSELTVVRTVCELGSDTIVYTRLPGEE